MKSFNNYLIYFRDLDKEKMKLERQEKQIINDIKKMAKQGEMAAVKVMAKDLVRTRRYVKKFIMMKANIQAVSLKITTLKSQGAMATSMKGVTKAMGAMNKQMNMPQMQKIMMDFEKEVCPKYGFPDLLYLACSLLLTCNYSCEHSQTC